MKARERNPQSKGRKSDRQEACLKALREAKTWLQKQDRKAPSLRDSLENESDETRTVPPPPSGREATSPQN